MTFLKNFFSNFRSHIKDSKWGRKCIFINCTSCNESPQQIPFQFANGKLPHSHCRAFWAMCWTTSHERHWPAVAGQLGRHLVSKRKWVNKTTNKMFMDHVACQDDLQENGKNNWQMKPETGLLSARTNCPLTRWRVSATVVCNWDHTLVHKYYINRVILSQDCIP